MLPPFPFFSLAPPSPSPRLPVTREEYVPRESVTRVHSRQSITPGPGRMQQRMCNECNGKGRMRREKGERERDGGGGGGHGRGA